MKHFYAALLLVCLVASPAVAKGLKVFISVDMEGVAGAVNVKDVRRGEIDYPMFREIMTRETNAAIAGAIAAGADEILVRDSHGAKNNILPELLDKRAVLLRGLSHQTGPKNMMEGIDKSFDAVIFLGYHASAGTPNAILEHTSNGNVRDFSINGVTLPEAGYNALVAGLYDVPVVMVSGDKAACAEMTRLLGNVEAVSVKEEINDASLGLHPEVARQRIRAAAERSLRNLKKYKPYKLTPPYNMRLELGEERKFIEGAWKVKKGVVAFKSNDLLEVLDAFNKMK